MKRWPLVASFALFLALCVSLAFWAMQLFKPPLRTVTAPPQVTQSAPNLDAAASLFGGRTTMAVASNFQLKGVVVSGNPASSIAILAADGKPAQAVRANREVVPGVTVKEVHQRYVLLSEGGVAKRVDLPESAKSGPGTSPAMNAPVSLPQAQMMPPQQVQMEQPPAEENTQEPEQANEQGGNDTSGVAPNPPGLQPGMNGRMPRPGMPPGRQQR
ncbi:MAG: type II secretion system protein N [Pseudomonadota bacterium]